MTRHKSPLEAAAKGAVSGLVGTVAITAGIKGIPVLMEQLGLTPPKLPAAIKSGNGQKTEEPTEKLAEKVATDVLETPLEEDTKELAGQAIHWGYGITWGAFYGLAQNQLQLSPHLHGLLFGTLVATVASTLVPAMGVAPPPTEQPMSTDTTMMSLNLLYGWVTAMTFDALEDSHILTPH